MSSAPAYEPRRAAAPERLSLRGVDVHLNRWGDAAMARPDRPTLVLLHGWMDIGASFQFVVDEMAALEGPTRHIVAPDWRGFGRSVAPPTDSYAFADYLGDLDALLRHLAPDGAPVDLLGHSMGGNVVMSYAGARPERVRRLVNLEGFGLPASAADDAPRRLAQWLDQLAEPAELRDYDDAAAVAGRLRKTNPRLPADKAAWLAREWAEPVAGGRWRLRADPAHKRVNPVPYRVDEVLALWRRIRAPLLWVQGDATEFDRWWAGRYTLAEFERRLALVRDRRSLHLRDAGHMLHHDQPATLARALIDFLA